MSRAPRFFGAVRKLGQSVPEAPHDPRERVLLRRAAGWELRAPLSTSADFDAREGLQLWQPDVGISVLTPSPSTGQVYEVLSIKGWKVRLAKLDAVAAVIKREYDLPFVSDQDLQRAVAGSARLTLARVPSIAMA